MDVVGPVYLETLAEVKRLLEAKSFWPQTRNLG
jgi:hypothetical protein